jgi:hypothetical protein
VLTCIVTDQSLMHHCTETIEAEAVVVEAVVVGSL